MNFLRSQRHRSVRGLAPAFVMSVLVGLASDQTHAEPRLPGIARLFEPRQPAGNVDAVTANHVAAQALATELRCSGCHVLPMIKQRVVPAPPLTDVAARVFPSYIKQFLRDPTRARPGTTMPNVLAQLPVGERDAAADELTHYLANLTQPLQPDLQWGGFQERDEGKRLFEAVGCVPCHGADGAGGAAHLISLRHLGAKTNLPSLRAFLADPQSVRPHSRMPNFRLTEDEHQALGNYLLRDQLAAASGGTKSLHKPGIRYEYFEGSVREGPPEWHDMKFVRRGVLQTFELPPDSKPTKFAVRYVGLLEVPTEGTYTLYVESNDGSELWLDKQLLVTNHGFHGALEVGAPVKLKPGLHPLTVSFWQDEGGRSIKVSWQGPGFKKQPIAAAHLLLPGSVPLRPSGAEAFAPDASKAARGAQRFAELRCGRCHTDGLHQVTAQPRAASSSTTLAPAIKRPDAGCLAAQVPPGAPDYQLNEDQRQSLIAVMKRWPKLSLEAQALGELATSNCLACHTRAGRGGPTQELNAFFTQTTEVDLGDEGRVPPPLEGAGKKLRRDAFARIVSRGELHVRPYMATRMPSFPLPWTQNVAALLARADGGNSAKPGKLPAAATNDGRRLIGTSSDPAHGGFGCINCHNLASRPAAGSPGPDLELAPVRLNYAWFDQWLAHPQAIRPDTRMPAFWSADPLFPDVAGGSAKRQRASIWAYLAGGATPLPAGLTINTAQSELALGPEPIVYRTFMKGAGPRAIVVGNPEMIHVAFDANVVRMAKAWRGRFWDPSGTWTGRAGMFNEPIGDHIIDLPPGPAFAVLASPQAPWPTASLHTRNLGGQFLGYRLDSERRPVFRYSQGAMEFSEVAEPRPGAAGVSLVRKFTVTKAQPNLYFLAAAGRRIERRAADRFVVEDQVEVRISGPLQKQAVIRKQGEVAQLLLRVPETTQSFDVEVRW